MRPEVKAWLDGSGPAPKGYGVKCSGCFLCIAEGHYPLRPRPLTERQAHEEAREEYAHWPKGYWGE